ncbi:50S ribosome-binding GTPase [Bacillus sp. FJAT-49732]|uniref:50S ribosome-binding GTPase n=1 Tax=Lederbergia citrisecunda TaxID=2833583 RepID=A0A942TNB6_9BACI|nr:LeoA/HP0731 family dynamin-like GTPase [Lederbergia citrisecunda]MBS4199329.1 50S ribosome-binding GTPase [Lederbergia citrisecunda]
MIQTFQNEKKKVLDKLYLLKDKLISIEKYDINFSQLIEKIDSAIKNIESEKFVVAMFGAFTDGKSTIISALTKNLDIRVAPEPITDGIHLYKYKTMDDSSNIEDIIIVDTPGLFSENVIHSERTIQYISEANVILYTVDPVNPLKQSHHETVKWLLEKLNKADATIFVINKMDEVADLDDSHDFDRCSRIKTETVINTINSITPLREEPKVICLAADPYGLGLEHWLQNEEEYYRLSRIKMLDIELDNVIKSSKNEFIHKAGISVIKDTLQRSIKQLENIRNELKKQIDLSENQLWEIETNLNKFKRDINTKYRNIKEEVLIVREDILSALDAVTDLKGLSNVMDMKVGKGGYILNEKLNLIVQKHTESLFNEQSDILHGIESSLDFHGEIQQKLVNILGKAGAKFGEKIAAQSAKEISKVILKVRDFAKIPIKFKPWGAIKWGDAVTKFGKFLQGLPVALNAISIISGIVSEQKLSKQRTNIKNEINNHFKDFISSFTIESYINYYFPVVEKEEEIRQNLEKIHIANRETQNNLELIIHELNEQDFELK